MLVDLLIPLAEAMPEVFKGGRRHRRIPESRMAIYIWRAALGDIAPRSLDAIMETLPCNLSPCRRGRGRVIGDRLRMRASGQGERQQ
jgi:hypothetical protein